MLLVVGVLFIGLMISCSYKKKMKMAWLSAFIATVCICSFFIISRQSYREEVDHQVYFFTEDISYVRGDTEDDTYILATCKDQNGNIITKSFPASNIAKVEIIEGEDSYVVVNTVGYKNKIGKIARYLDWVDYNPKYDYDVYYVYLAEEMN